MRVGGPHGDEPVGVRVRKRRQEHRIDNAEDGGVGADAEREREDGREGEGGSATKAAQRVRHIAEGLIDDRHAAAIAIRLFRRLEPAKLQDGVAARLVGRHAGPDAGVDVQLQVALELLGQVGVAMTAPHEVAEPPHPRAQASHHRSPGPVGASEPLILVTHKSTSAVGCASAA